MFYQLWINQLVAQAGEGGTSISEILKTVDCSRFIVRKSLQQLRDIGFLKRVGNRFYSTIHGRNAHYAEVLAIAEIELSKVSMEVF